MDRRVTFQLCAPLVLLAIAGCASDGAWSALSPWSRISRRDSGTTALASDQPAAAITATAAASSSSTEPTANPVTVRPGMPDPAAMQAVLAQLRQTGAIDQAAQERLIADLAQTDPALWPQLIEVFRASLAYRQKYGERPVAPDELPPSGRRPVAVVPGSREPVDIDATASDRPEASQSSITRVPAKGPDLQVKLASAEMPSAAQVGDVTTAAPATTAGKEELIATTDKPEASTTKTTPAPTSAEPPRLDWRENLQAAIQGLEAETTEPPATTGEIGRHAALRMLYLVDGRRESALKPIAGIPASQQDFWGKELFGLATYLDSERMTDQNRRAAAAVVALREAATKLGELGTLSVRNLAFCSEVHSYGVYKKFPKNEFHAGQEVLLYAEVENFQSMSTEKGFHTALKSSYQILDNHGARVDQKEFEVTAEDCQNPRRDYFMRYFVWMPKRIYGGSYTLQLTIEDTQSQKIGQSSIDFTIDEKDQ